MNARREAFARKSAERRLSHSKSAEENQRHFDNAYKMIEQGHRSADALQQLRQNRPEWLRANKNIEDERAARLQESASRARAVARARERVGKFADSKVLHGQDLVDFIHYGLRNTTDLAPASGNIEFTEKVGTLKALFHASNARGQSAVNSIATRAARVYSNPLRAGSTLTREVQRVRDDLHVASRAKATRSGRGYQKRFAPRKK